ncbi:uncharacterized protein LOC128264423 [Drosophila gunungcola]|uniref:Uncharacterized protein n=1 Tax=Drosophila gunungcola TaxID=103775 RepID=A0A9Q0BJK3_9MUSC|nr:uncharacterized protein LOC128264423 [Drosophila gunungcola]KAI8034537.1 hypothetical protein M5D96_012724 [Drosophila gunungcola]
MVVLLILGLVCAILMTLVVVALKLLGLKPPLIFDKYPLKGIFYRVKFWLALLVLRRLRYRIYRRNEELLGSEEHLAKIDRPQELGNDPKSYDVVSFMAANEEGQKLMVTLERRRRGVLKAALYLWLPGRGLFSSPNLPDMIYFTTEDGEEGHEFRGGGFHVYQEESMKVWRIKYEGVLKSQGDSVEAIPVDLDLRFKSSSAEHFDYNRDLSSSLIADSIAREAWNEKFYSLIQSVNHIVEKRTHYEQNGELRGKIVFKGEEIALKMLGFRDHSFGTERCLSSINRYVYFALFLDDGSSMVVGNLSQPSFFLSSLKVGYVCSPSGKYQPLTFSNFELYSYGEKGIPPQHQNFIVRTEEKEYLIQIQVEGSAVRYVGGDWESKVFNQFVACTVNGVTGQGHAEFLYRNKGGRPEAISSRDPSWYQNIKRFERSLTLLDEQEDGDFIF